jgi:hypothetical protein
MTEPTIERGYAELVRLQNFIKNSWKSALLFNNTDLSAPIELFKIMADDSADSGKKTLAREAYAAIFAGDRATFVQKATAADIHYDGSVKPYLPGSNPSSLSLSDVSSGGGCNSGVFISSLLAFAGFMSLRKRL